MRLFDVLGPVMIGPSSSHTAGAARIGYTAQKLLGEIPAQADIGLYGSFATTGKGHGTDKALIAGFLGMQVDDPAIPDSFRITANFSGDYPTLIVHNIDQPGHVTEVTSMLAHKGVNIATMQLYRKSRGGSAVMVIECDQEVPKESLAWLERLEGILKVTYCSLVEE